MRVQDRMKEIVKEMSVNQGIKQKYIAQKCGFTEKELSYLINGKKTARDTDIEKFCYGLSLSPNDLFQMFSSKPER